MSRFIAGVLGVAIVACSSGGQGGGNSGSTSASQFPDAYADALCGLFERCCAERQLSFDGASCRSMVRDGVAPALQQLSPNQQFDSASADECLSLIGALACSGPKSDSDACERFINGTLPPGSPCADDAECFQDAAAIGARCREGTCKRIPRVPVGGSCVVDDTTDPQCESETYCKDGSCQPPEPAGTPCTQPSECESHSCNTTCEALIPNGAPCGLAACESDNCDTATQTCIAKLPLGAACASRLDCQSDACVDGLCAPERVVGTAESCAGNLDF